MRTTNSFPFPMKDVEYTLQSSHEYMNAAITKACDCCNMHRLTSYTPCWVFQTLGIGMDHDFTYLLFQFPSEENGMQMTAHPLSVLTTVRLINAAKTQQLYDVPAQTSHHESIRRSAR